MAFEEAVGRNAPLKSAYLVCLDTSQPLTPYSTHVVWGGSAQTCGASNLLSWPSVGTM